MKPRSLLCIRIGLMGAIACIIVFAACSSTESETCPDAGGGGGGEGCPEFGCDCNDGSRQSAAFSQDGRCGSMADTCFVACRDNDGWAGTGTGTECTSCSDYAQACPPTCLSTDVLCDDASTAWDALYTCYCEHCSVECPQTCTGTGAEGNPCMMCMSQAVEDAAQCKSQFDACDAI